MSSKQAGNAILIILIAVFLFGALAAAFMRGTRTGQTNLTAGQTRLAAQQILEYSGQVARAVDKLRQKGCSESQISFENAYDSYNVNPNAPITRECHVFEPQGTNLTVLRPPSAWFKGVLGEYQFFYTAADSIDGVGTSCGDASCSELNINIWDITQPLCEEINRQLNIEFGTIPSSSIQGCSFTGDFLNGCAPAVVFTDPDLMGKMAVCYNDTSYGYVFNSVILER